MNGPAISPIAARLEAVRGNVGNAARSVGRRPEELTLIVVTKFHPSSMIRELYDLGVRDFGESRHQEAQKKAGELAALDLTWHFVGQLQTKKARQVARYAQVIHSIDRAPLVDALDAVETPLDCFVQVNLTPDPARGGVQFADVEPIAERVIAARSLRLLGVMAIAPLGEDPRRAFARLRAASETVCALAPEASSISAGMSQDYRDAIAEGATHLRIGTAITGNRPQHG